MSHSIINQLDDITANQIAAGEVVERPASVIKELVENSIDAKATKIKIEVEEGGTKLMRIIDNGIGMCREDSVLCLQRHATSKISKSSDLSEIKTLGFRGEALPSIASVSNLKLFTCDNEDNQGSVLSVKGGVIENIEDVALPKGTVIEVCDLFYNTPARLKFLKSKSTEYSHIVNIISEYAICYPNIRFELVKDKKQVLISAPNGNRMNAIASVLGLEVAKGLISFSAEDKGIKVYGYVSKGDFVKGYNSFKIRREVHNKVNIYRSIDVRRGNGSNLSVFLNYVFFPIASLFCVKKLSQNKYDAVLVYQMSPVFMGISGMKIAKKLNIPLYTYVAELWPDSFYSVIDVQSNLFKKAIEYVTEKTYQKSDKIIVQSDKMRKMLADMLTFQDSQLPVVTNYPDQCFRKNIEDISLLEKTAGSFNLVMFGDMNDKMSAKVVVGISLKLRADRIKNVRFIIIGKSDSITELKKLVKRKVVLKSLY